jgi:hypothetical protein
LYLARLIVDSGKQFIDLTLTLQGVMLHRIDFIVAITMSVEAKLNSSAIY